MCGKITGDNPYNVQRDPTLPPGAHLHIFDLLNPEGEFLPPAKRHELVGNYQLPIFPNMGQFTADKIEKLIEILLDLNDRVREGVVLKSLDGKRIMKFVTPSTDLQDIRDGLIIDYDLHHRYFRNRILRAIIFIQEFGLDKEKYKHRFGETFLQGYSSLESFSKSHEYYSIYVQEEETWRATEKLIQDQVSVKTDNIEPVKLNGQKMLRVKCRRIYTKSTHRYQSILKGFPHTG